MKIIKYNRFSKISLGTDELPVIMGWNETNEKIAKKEAYDGDYIVVDDRLSEPDTSTTDDVLAALLGV